VIGARGASRSLATAVDTAVETSLQAQGNRMKKLLATLITSISVCTAVAANAAGTTPGGSDAAQSNSKQAKNYSPYAQRNHPRRLLWGDSHVHTSLSSDAGMAANRLSPEFAYRFARGEEVVSSMGIPAKLSRPLDWLTIADHTDGMGMVGDLLTGDPELMAFEQVARWNKGLLAGGEAATAAKVDLINTFSAGKVDPKLLAMYAPGSDRFNSIWQGAVETAEEFNEPGRFTALIGYEWTSLINGNNMHRVVIMRDGPDKALQMAPYTTVPPLGSPDPRDLWKYMQKYERDTGGRILAIPHNGNLSNGIMFPLEAQWNGRAFDKEYLEQRARMEPLVEMSQGKGDGEAHPFLSPDDRFADFETWDLANLDGTQEKTSDMLAGEYAREALKRGLDIGQRQGTNPYKFGMIAATDTHTSLASAEEENFFGKNSTDAPGPQRMDFVARKIGDKKLMNWQVSASGLAAVWATENNREAIFDAMQRKEVYGTTGPRIVLRVFGGWGFSAGDLDHRPIENIGYANGVPMGGDLPPRPAGVGAPSFMISALRDPMGANLDRIQVVKGWLAADGSSREKVFNVAWSGDRELDGQGQLPPVGNTVNSKTATWSNSIGTAQLSTVWRDPQFDPAQDAFYYVRVLEIPTPRWTTYDAVFFGRNIPEGAPVAIQERAYSSPIWYDAD